MAPALAYTLKLGRQLTQGGSRAVQAMRRTRGRAAGSFQRIVWAALLLVLAASSQQGNWHHAPLLHGRSVIQELSETIRSMHWRAATSGQPMELRIDAHRGCLHVVAFEGRRRVVEVVERTFWLPEPLKILEAPAVLRVVPGQPHERTTLLLSAPAYSRLFRVTIWPDGRVSVREEVVL